jgi:hypothetical protein
MRDSLKTLRGALRSRVVWFNVITGSMEVANALSPVVPPGTVTAVNVAGNIALRFLTSQPLADKVPTPEQ